IRTDSLGAIAGLNKNLELHEGKKWMKEKYFDWLIKIKDIVKIK
ncbi:8790_t:CDS:1, partial [Gigaspora rosea]